jgi:hypothetical protein
VAGSLRVILQSKDQIDKGQFADVFRPNQGDRVVKLFRRSKRPEGDRDAIHSFRREKIAYENVMRYAELRKHVPEYFGIPEIADVLDASGSSVASGYLLDCCLELAFIPGPCLKFYELPDEAIAVQLLESFDGKLAYDYDGSFFNWDDQERIIAIDFAPTD